MLSHVDSSQLDNTLQLLGSELPRWSQLLAVAAPWSIKLDEPHRVVIEHLFLEVSCGEFDDGAWEFVEGLSHAG